MADSHPQIVTLSGDSADDVQSHRSGQSNKVETATPPTSSSPIKGKGRKSPTSKKRALSSTRNAGHAVKKTKRREPEEEGEASSLASSPPSLRSASMSESAPDDSPTGGKNQPLRFPVDGKFASEAEKAEVMALPEVRREEILAERATMIERDQQNRMLIQLLRDKGRKDVKDTKESKDMDAADKKKRKAPAADLEENQRKSTRQKTTLGGRKVGESSAPLEEYKRQREQRGAQIEQKKKEDAIKGRAQKRVEEHFDADAEGESEDDWGTAKRPKRTTASPPKVPAAKSATPPQKAPAPILREEEPADLQDFNRARFGRAGFGRFCFYPGFEEAITGCIVRLAMGVDDASGQNRYVVGEIKRFTEGKPYALEGPTGSRFVTTQYLIAAHGKQDKEFPFIFCSDSKITQAELDRFKRHCTDDSVPIPNKSFLIKKTVDINRLINHKLTNDELNEKLRRSGAQARRMAPILRAQIRVRRDMAIAQGDEATVAKLDAELATINGPKLAFGTKLYDDPPEQKVDEEQLRVAQISARNRKLNSDEIRKAELRELEARRVQEDLIARGLAQRNPSARIKTRVTFMHDYYANVPKPIVHNEDNNEDFDDLFDEPPESSEAVTPQTPEPSPPAKGMEAPPAASITEDITAADSDTSGLDSDLDLEIVRDAYQGKTGGSFE